MKEKLNSSYLSEVRSFTGLILGDLVKSVLLALLSLAVSFSFLWNVDHSNNDK